MKESDFLHPSNSPEVLTETLCTQSNGEAAVRADGLFTIKSYHCGKNTWLDMVSYAMGKTSASGLHSNRKMSA